MAFKFGPIPYLELEFNQLGNAPVGNPTSVSDWNTFFDLPNYGTPFTKVRIIGNIIRLYGGENITLKSQIFQSRPLKKISDSKIIIKANDNSFYGCTSLTSVSLFGLINAGNYCFYNCTSLTSISLPSLTSAGNRCFSDNSNLISVFLPVLDDTSDGWFVNCTSLQSVSLPSYKFVGSITFYNCTSLTSISLPIAKYISTSAFENCTSLTSISLPLVEFLTGGSEFKNCTSLTSISLPACINILYDLSFSSCTALTSISLPVCIALGSSVLNNNLFLGITGKTISLTIPASRMTCNGGNPDGDIQYLQANNTVTITTT